MAHEPGHALGWSVVIVEIYALLVRLLHLRSELDQTANRDQRASPGPGENQSAKHCDISQRREHHEQFKEYIELPDLGQPSSRIPRKD